MAVFDTPINTSDQSLDRVLAAGLPVALVFLNGSPSANLDEALKRLAREHAGQLLIARVQTGDNPQSVQRYNISGAPAMVTFKDGKEQTRASNISAADLESHVNYLLGRGPKPQPKQTTSTSTDGYSGSIYGQPGASSAGQRPSSNGGGHPVTVSDHTFEREVLQANQPVLVDFWAPWCGPCRMTEPTLEKLAREYPGRLKVAKVNVDENPHLAREYGVQSIPTMMVVKNGQVVDRWMGALPEGPMRGKVQRWI